jgi:hypothetical protein
MPTPTCCRKPRPWLALPHAEQSAPAAGKVKPAQGGTRPRGPAEMKYDAAFVLDPDGNNIEAGIRE